MVIYDGSIETTSGTALDIQDSTVDIGLTSVSSTDAENGIQVIDTNGQVIVFGKTDDASGGTITGAENAIFVSGTEKVGFQHMLLEDNETGIKIEDSGDFYLSESIIRTVDTWGVDAINARLVSIDNSILESNGESEHNRIRFLADKEGSYELGVSNSILAANDGSAIQVESLSGSEGSTLGVVLSSNDLYVSHTATTGLDIDWNGTSSVTLYGNEFVSEYGDKTILDFNGIYTTDLSSITIQQNLFTMTGSNDAAVNIKTAGESDIVASGNYLFLSESDQTGFLFDLAEDADVNLSSNILTSSDASATAVLFDFIGDHSSVVFTGNAFALDTNSSLIDRGLIFDTIDGVIDLTGQNNSITGAGEIFSAPTDHISGRVIINGSVIEGEASDD
ncbi:MAG: hypothetical protein R3C11_24405 [Planctomycetaceae bacterium]